MNEILDFLLQNESLSLTNEENGRTITISVSKEDCLDVFENGDSAEPILTSDDYLEIMDCFEEGTCMNLSI